MVSSPRDVHTVPTASARETFGHVRDMRLRAIVISLLVVAACKSANKIAFERVAKEINPILATLKSKVAKILETSGGDLAQTVMTIKACKSAEPELKNLRSIDLNDQSLDPEWLHDASAPWKIHLLTSQVLEDWDLRCHDYESQPRWAASWCRRWCVEMFTVITQNVEHLRDDARNEGVHIVSLKP